MDQTMLIWGVVLLAAALLLAVLEIFVPSGGLIAVLSTISAVAGVVALFRYDTTWGVSGLLVSLVLGPTVVAFGLRVFPSTPMGRRLIGAKTEEEAEADRQAELAERRRWLALVGAEGQALTDLRPVGAVRIDGQRYDALAETSFISIGQRVRVTAVEGTQVKVRAIG